MRAFFAILVVALIAFVFWRGWLQFHVTNNADQTNTTLTVNKNKIEQDINSLKNREHAVTTNAPAPGPTEVATPPQKTNRSTAETTVRGRVQNATPNQLSVLTADGQTIRVVLTPTTTITIAARAARSTDIKVGDTVTAIQAVTDAGPVATAVAVDAR